MKKPTIRIISMVAEHPRTGLVVVHAILPLSTDDRQPEEIWLSPTSDEWLQVAKLAADYGDDDDFMLTESYREHFEEMRHLSQCEVIAITTCASAGRV